MISALYSTIRNSGQHEVILMSLLLTMTECCFWLVVIFRLFNSAINASGDMDDYE